MDLNWRVYTKTTSYSPWVQTGIIESNKELAEKIWLDIIKRLQYHSFKLEPITYGIPIDRLTVRS